MVSAPRTSVIDAASEALSKEPVPAAAAAIISILEAKEEDTSADVVLTVVIDAANEALFAFTVLERLFIDVAAEELLVVIVLFIFVIDELNDDDAE